MVVACVAYAVKGDFDGVLVALLAVYRHVDRVADHFQLFDGCGAVHVASDEQGAFPLGGFQLLGELAGECGLARALEAGHEYHCRVAFDVEGNEGLAHEFGEFLMDYFQHQLLGLDGVEDVLSHSLFFDGVDEAFGDLVVDVGVNEGAAHLLECLRHVDFGDAALAFEDLERAFEPLLK